MTINAIFHGVLDRANIKIPFAIFYNPAPTSPDSAYMGQARYRGKRFIMFADDADDCRLGLHAMLQEYDAKKPAATMEPGSTVH